MADPVRPSASVAVQALQELGIQTVRLAGDNARTAGAVARELGLDTVIATVLPEEKSAQIKLLQGGGRRVAMIGNGLNDTPALAQANMGIATLRGHGHDG